MWKHMNISVWLTRARNKLPIVSMAAERGFLQDTLLSAPFKMHLSVAIQGTTGVRIIKRQPRELSITLDPPVGKN